MPDNNENLDLTYDAPGTTVSGEEAAGYIIKQHDEDVIFYKESLEEFIRLIQRQGINNLTIYSVSDLLAGDKYKTITARFPPPNWDPDKGPPQEFEFNELKDRKGYFVFVRFSYSWEGDVEGNGAGPVGKKGFINERQFTENEAGEYHSLNEINGRHIFVKTINDIKFYTKYTDAAKTQIDTKESSVFHVEISDENPIPDIVGDNGDYMKDGTFTITVDNIQYVIKIKGFNDDGEYEGIVKLKDGDKALNNNATATAVIPRDEQKFFLRSDGVWSNSLGNNLLPTTAATYSLGTPTYTWKNLYLSDSATTGDLLPNVAATNPTSATHAGKDIGAPNNRWDDVWAQRGNFSGGLVLGGTANGGTCATLVINNRPIAFDALPTSIDTTNHFWRGDASWNDTLTGNFILSYAAGATGNYIPTNATPSDSAGAVFRCSGAGWFGRNLTANKVFKAVFNDYAEFHSYIDLTPGHVVVDNDDGSLSCSSKRLQPGAQVISDTFGDAMGYDENNKTPLAVAGRVLVYPYQPRENYHAGMAVCSAPDGTVDIMTREEIRDYPDCIIGIVSEIPQYERWGTEQVEVNGRIWIKVK